MDSIRDDFLPVLDLVGENVILFTSIADALKDAVLAGEKEWVLNTRQQYKQIEENFILLSSYHDLVDAQEIALLRSYFNSYFENAFSLSLAMLSEDASITEKEHLIENVENFHSLASSGFVGFKATLQRRFSEKIDATNQRLKRLLWVGVGMGVILILLITAITFKLSLGTRRSLNQVNRALKNIAQEKPDFSARIVSVSNDELGELVHWFNMLSEKLERDYKKIELLSITDKLTQLYNRTKIDELFEMELERADRYREPLSVLLLDLDHFKSVNDRHGHQVGDRVLQDLARVLRENVRASDHIGRWGGEEFIIIAPNTDMPQAQVLGEKIRSAVEQYPFHEVGQKTASFGVSVFRSGDGEDDMTKRADACLYVAKARGRNVVVAENELR